MRQRRTASSLQSSKASEITSEQYIRAFGQRYGWDLGPCNVMFEGATDVAYMEIANELYAAKTELTLIDDSFRLFAIGLGEEGGTEGMLDRLRLLAETLRIFPIEDAKLRIRVICMFDDDAIGRGAFRTMSGKFVPWSDIYLLRRRYPRTVRKPREFENAVNKVNEVYLSDKKFFCEIEDLISRGFIDDFVNDDQRYLQREIRVLGDGFHCDLERWAKAKLVSKLEQQAILADVELLVDLLKSLRFLFGLPVDGTPVS